jgi:hypothetical protein
MDPPVKPSAAKSILPSVFLLGGSDVFLGK